MGIVVALIAVALVLGLLGAVISALKGLVLLALVLVVIGLVLGAGRSRKRP